MVRAGLPMGLHRWLALAGAIVFAALAGAHAQETGFAGAGLWSAIALGVFFGRILVPLFNITVKLLLLCLCLAVLGAIGWVSYGLITGAL